jgi:hypothetical protein
MSFGAATVRERLLGAATVRERVSLHPDPWHRL